MLQILIGSVYARKTLKNDFIETQMVEKQKSLAYLLKTVSISAYETPMELPLSHLSRDEWLADIVHDGILKPQIHSILDEKDRLIFLMYGGIFYRSSIKPSKDKLRAPIAFVFHPRILEKVYKYYPFDTGMIQGKIGKSWTKTLEPIHLKYAVRGLGDRLIPRKLVQCLFGSNEKFLQGEPSLNCKSGNFPLPELYKFYTADLTQPDFSDGRVEGVDRRQCVIECQFDCEISLLNDLIWIGFPYQDWDLIDELYKKHADKINLRCYPYNFTNIFRPNELEKELENAARKDLVDELLNHERRQEYVIQSKI